MLLKAVKAIRNAVKEHPKVNEVIELLTIHPAPKQIPVNAHVNLKIGLTNEQIIQTIIEIEKKMKQAEPKVDKIFLETTGLKEVRYEK